MSLPLLVGELLVGESAMHGDSVIVHRTQSDGTFKFKHAPIPTNMLFFQSQRDTVPYIQSTSTSAQAEPCDIAIVGE